MQIICRKRYDELTLLGWTGMYFSILFRREKDLHFTESQKSCRKPLSPFKGWCVWYIIIMQCLTWCILINSNISSNQTVIYIPVHSSCTVLRSVWVCKNSEASLLAYCYTNTRMSLLEWVGANNIHLDRHSVALVHFWMCERCVYVCVCMGIY